MEGFEEAYIKVGLFFKLGRAMQVRKGVMSSYNPNITLIATSIMSYVYAVLGHVPRRLPSRGLFMSLIRIKLFN